KRGALSARRLREVAAVAAQRARDLKGDHYSFDLPTAEGVLLADATPALVEGSLLGLYRYLNYKTHLTSEDRREIAALTDVSGVVDESVARGAAVGEVVARSVALARDLANAPGNDLTPTKLAEAAQAMAERTGVAATVLGLEDLRQQGFGGILGVAQGSAQE